MMSAREAVMAWKQTSHPTVQQQRDKWVVRVDGIDTVSGARKPRQLGTYRSRRSARAAASAYAASGESGAERNKVGAVVDGWVAGKVDVSNKSRLQYEWAAGHIKAGLGGVRLDRLDRDDVGRWLDDLANGGKLSRRSIQIMRMVLSAALDDAVDGGQLRRKSGSTGRHAAQRREDVPRARSDCVDGG
jgi:hypothetical protein